MVYGMGKLGDGMHVWHRTLACNATPVPNSQVANDPGKEESDWHETYRVLSLDAAAPSLIQLPLGGTVTGWVFWFRELCY